MNINCPICNTNLINSKILREDNSVYNLSTCDKDFFTLNFLDKNNKIIGYYFNTNKNTNYVQVAANKFPYNCTTANIYTSNNFEYPKTVRLNIFLDLNLNDLNKTINRIFNLINFS